MRGSRGTIDQFGTLKNSEEGGADGRHREDGRQNSSRPGVLHSSAGKLLRAAADHVVQGDDTEGERELGVHPVVLLEVVRGVEAEPHGAAHERDHERGDREAFVDAEGDLAAGLRVPGAAGDRDSDRENRPDPDEVADDVKPEEEEIHSSSVPRASRAVTFLGKERGPVRLDQPEVTP